MSIIQSHPAGLLIALREILYDGEEMFWGFNIPSSRLRHALFKLELELTGSMSRLGLADDIHSTLLLPPSYSIRAEKMTTDYLSALRKYADEYILKRIPEKEFLKTKKSYCLTVPAVWSDHAMQRTRECAINAGMTDILMVTEPEAAALFTLDALKPHGLEANSLMLVCDAGGGTVDLTTYNIEQLDPALRLREVTAGMGGFCGSGLMNRRFEQYLLSKFEDEEDWSLQTLADALEWFERTKYRFVGDERDLEKRFAVPIDLADNQALGIRRGSHHITGYDIQGFFQPVCDQVVRLIQEQVDQVKPQLLNSVLLVGGFGQSVYLRERIRSSLDPSVKLLQPPNGYVRP